MSLFLLCANVLRGQLNIRPKIINMESKFPIECPVIVLFQHRFGIVLLLPIFMTERELSFYQQTEIVSWTSLVDLDPHRRSEALRPSVTGSRTVSDRCIGGTIANLFSGPQLDSVWTSLVVFTVVQCLDNLICSLLSFDNTSLMNKRLLHFILKTNTN